MSAGTLEKPLLKTSEPLVERDHPKAAEFTVTIDLQRLMRVLVAIMALLLVSGTAANIITNQVAPTKEHKLAKLMNRFDLGFEPSIPNWYSSFSLLACSIILGTIAAAAWRPRTRWRWHWLILSGLFLLLAIDEGVRFHEMLHTVMVEFVEPSGLLFFPWVIPAMIFVAIVGLSYLPFLWRLPRRTALLFTTAGAVFVGGAVGMDVIGGVLVEQYGMESVQHSIAQFFEEFGEMLGVLIFAYALLEWIRDHVGAVRLQIGGRGGADPSTAS